MQNLGLVGVPFLGSRPLGVDQLGHYLLDHWEESMAVHNTTFLFLGVWVYFSWDYFLNGWKPYMLAFVGQPSLLGYYACMVFWDKGALRRNCRPKKCKTSFSPSWVFLYSRYSLKDGGVRSFGFCGLGGLVILVPFLAL